jgi:NACHT domain/Restriction endonuclease
MTIFTPETLPAAVRSLFELNNYAVDGPREIHGAEIDLIATPKSDPFGAAIYIEVTVEYVDNAKYGKDLTKLAMIREKQPGARRIIVSSTGFSAPVRERAEAAGITTLTYDELFARFERFEPYIRAVTNEESAVGRELQHLASIYEEPNFEDPLGTEVATQFLTDWRVSANPERRWLILTGEYGTGKTALTKVLQYRWALDYQRNPTLPVPFRIELRDFTRQFDARGLLHHFLDKNQLGHVAIDFVFSLLRSGRVILLLDGYDEMAQYMHARERRTCLEALAHLAADGRAGC